MLQDIAAERAAQAAAGDRADRARQRTRRARDKLARTRDRVEEQARERAEREAAAAAADSSIPGTRPVPVDDHHQVRMAAERVARAEQRLARILDPEPAPAGSPREAKRNLTDPDSRIMKTRSGWIQGYNGQLVVSADYLILAAELTNDPTDVEHYQPMISAAEHTADRVNADTGSQWRIGCALADAGYASTDNLTAPGPDRLIALGTRRDTAHNAATQPADGDPPPHATPRQQMDHRLRTPEGSTLYRQRGAIVEPVNGHLKDRRALRQFARRGLTAARSEFRFAAAVTNLLRLHTHLATS
jgi:hypothetical protein